METQEPAHYDVIEVPWFYDDETLGSKEKFWCIDREERFWLFKKPRPDTGEAWAEKIAAEIAKFMDVPCARVELATYEDVFGTMSLSFADLKKGFEHVHGNEILPIIVSGYEKEKKYHQSDHTYERIMETLKQISAPMDWSHPTTRMSATDVFAGYLTLDALIGNTDRHHENWGFLLRRDEGSGLSKSLSATLSPSYDHASSLGRELKDERRKEMLQKGNLPNYVERPRSPIYWDSNDPHGLSPIELVRRAARIQPGAFQPWLENAIRLPDSAFEGIFGRMPTGWISEVSVEFAMELLRNTREKLREIREVLP